MRSNEEIVRYLTKLKDEQDISISEIARRVGMSKSVVSQYFNGKRGFPLNHVEEFARALKVSPEDIMGIDPHTPTTPTPTAKTADLDEDDVLFTYQGKPLSAEDKALIRRLMKGKE